MKRLVTLAAACVFAGFILLTSCERKTASEVVIYSSIDDPYLRPIMRRFEQQTPAIDPHDCREHALQFGTKRFAGEFTTFVEQAWSAFGPSGR